MMLHGHHEWAVCVAFSKDSRTLFSAGGTRTSRGEARAWNVEPGRGLAGLEKRAIHAGAWSRDGKLLALGLGNGDIKLCDPSTGQVKTTLKGHKKMVRCLAISPDGQTLASASNDETVRLWDLTTNREKGELTRHRRPIFGLAFSPDGKQLASC